MSINSCQSSPLGQGLKDARQCAWTPMPPPGRSRAPQPLFPISLRFISCKNMIWKPFSPVDTQFLSLFWKVVLKLVGAIFYLNNLNSSSKIVWLITWTVFRREKERGDKMPAELGRIDLGDVTPHNIKLLRKVNTVVFPVSYHDKFYKVIKQYLLTVFSKCLSRMCLNLVSWRSWRTSTTLWLGRSVVEWTCKAPAGRFSLQRIQFSWILFDQTPKSRVKFETVNCSST